MIHRHCRLWLKDARFRLYNLLILLFRLRLSRLSKRLTFDHRNHLGCQRAAKSSLSRLIQIEDKIVLENDSNEAWRCSLRLFSEAAALLLLSHPRILTTKSDAFWFQNFESISASKVSIWPFKVWMLKRSSESLCAILNFDVQTLSQNIITKAFPLSAPF